MSNWDLWHLFSFACNAHDDFFLLGHGVILSINKDKFELNRKEWSKTFQEFIRSRVGGRFPWEQQQKVAHFEKKSRDVTAKTCVTIDQLLRKGTALKFQLNDVRYSYLGNSLAFGTHLYFPQFYFTKFGNQKNPLPSQSKLLPNLIQFESRRIFFWPYICRWFQRRWRARLGDGQLRLRRGWARTSRRCVHFARRNFTCQSRYCLGRRDWPLVSDTLRLFIRVAAWHFDKETLLSSFDICFFVQSGCHSCPN